MRRLFLPLVCLMLFIALPALAQNAPTITISPASGAIGAAIWEIAVDGLDDNTAYTIEFVLDGDVVYETRKTSDAAGRISFAAGNITQNEPGLYIVQVTYDGRVVASIDFEFVPAESEAASDLPGAVSVFPDSGPINTLHRVYIDGLEANTAYILEITAANAVVYKRRWHSSDTGVIELEIFAEDGDAPGQHILKVLDEAGILAAVGEFKVEAPPERDPAIAVSPQNAAPGENIAITISGLAAFDGFIVQIAGDALPGRTSDEGTATLTYAIPSNLPNGDYAIKLLMDDRELAATSLTIEAKHSKDDGISLHIAPPAGLIGTTHTVTASGLRPSELAEVEVDFEGERVFRTPKIADADGIITLDLVADADDPPGEYIVALRRRKGYQPSAILTVTAADTRLFAGRLDSANIEFGGEQGQYILITVSAADFEPMAALYDEAGMEIAQNNYLYHYRKGTARIGPLKLPASGLYWLEVFAEDAAAEGDFTAAIQSLQPAPVAFGVDIPFALHPNTPTGYFELAVEAGDSLTLTIDSRGALDTVMQILRDDGFEFAFDDDSGRGLDAEIHQLVFVQDGVYSLAISAFGGAAGEGILRVERQSAQTLDEGGAVVTLDGKVQRSLLVFDAAADEVITLDLARLEGDVPDLFVAVRVDGVEIMSYYTAALPEKLPLSFVMPTEGQALVALERFGAEDGISLRVSLSRG